MFYYKIISENGDIIGFSNCGSPIEDDPTHIEITAEEYSQLCIELNIEDFQ